MIGYELLEPLSNDSSIAQFITLKEDVNNNDNAIPFLTLPHIIAKFTKGIDRLQYLFYDTARLFSPSYLFIDHTLQNPVYNIRYIPITMRYYLLMVEGFSYFLKTLFNSDLYPVLFDELKIRLRNALLYSFDKEQQAYQKLLSFYFTSSDIIRNNLLGGEPFLTELNSISTPEYIKQFVMKYILPAEQVLNTALNLYLPFNVQPQLLLFIPLIKDILSSLLPILPTTFTSDVSYEQYIEPLLTTPFQKIVDTIEQNPTHIKTWLLAIEHSLLSIKKYFGLDPCYTTPTEQYTIPYTITNMENKQTTLKITVYQKPFPTEEHILSFTRSLTNLHLINNTHIFKKIIFWSGATTLMFHDYTVFVAFTEKHRYIFVYDKQGNTYTLLNPAPNELTILEQVELPILSDIYANLKCPYLPIAYRIYAY